MAAPKKIAGHTPKQGSLGSSRRAAAGSQHEARNHTETGQGWTSSFNMDRKKNAGARHAAGGEHGPGPIGGRKSHVAGDCYSMGTSTGGKALD